MDWGSKHVGAVIRLAGLINLAEHVKDGWGRAIDAQTIDRAAQLGAYFASHALAAFDDMGADPLVEDARHILAWITRTSTRRFTKRDLFAAIRQGRFRRATDLDAPLTLLEAHGYLQPEPATEREGPGRPASPAWLVHPDASRTPATLHPITAAQAAS